MGSEQLVHSCLVSILAVEREEKAGGRTNKLLTTIFPQTDLTGL